MFSHRPDLFRPLFSIFGVSVLCFRLCLCFRFVFRACLCFRFVFRVGWICVSGMGFGVWFRRLGNWIWVWWVSTFSCGWFCGYGFVLWCAVGLLVLLCWFLVVVVPHFFFFLFLFCFFLWLVILFGLGWEKRLEIWVGFFFFFFFGGGGGGGGGCGCGGGCGWWQKWLWWVLWIFFG